jgi:Timeless protein
MSTLHAVKAAFTEPDTLSIVTALCHGPLSHFPQMTKEDRDTLQLFLTFVRNLLWIPDATDHEQSLGRAHFGTLQVQCCQLLALPCAQVLRSTCSHLCIASPGTIMVISSLRTSPGVSKSFACAACCKLGLRLQVDFIQVALDENVLELVASIAQHIELPVLQGDAHLVLQLLQDVYSAFDPHTLQKTCEDILLHRTCARCPCLLLFLAADCSPCYGCVTRRPRGQPT